MFSQTCTSKRNSFFAGSVRPYTYDIQGNVYKLISDYPNGVIGDKTVEYDYDLQNGKTLVVVDYNKQGKVDKIIKYLLTPLSKYIHWQALQ